MKLEDYINMLQGRLEAVGNVDVCITQEGNYSEGIFADLYEIPEVELLRVNGTYEWVDGEYKSVEPDIRKFIVLGHSDQWC